MSIQLFGPARLGRDAELQSSANGTTYCRLSLAFSLSRKGQDGKRQTTWIDGVLFGKPAEALSEYLTKGREVAVTLRDIKLESWDKPDGTQGHKISGNVTEIDLIGGTGERTAAPPPAPKPAPRPALPASPGFDDDDSDVPF